MTAETSDINRICNDVNLPFIRAGNLWQVDHFEAIDDRTMVLDEGTKAFMVSESGPQTISSVPNYEVRNLIAAVGLMHGELKDYFNYKNSLEDAQAIAARLQERRPELALAARGLREQIWHARLQDYREQIEDLNKTVATVGEQLWVRTVLLRPSKRIEAAGKLTGFYLVLDNHGDSHPNVVVEDKKGQKGKLGNIHPFGLYAGRRVEV